MINILKISLLVFLSACLITSCGGDEECNETCPAGQILDINCNCVELAADPCPGIVCPDGQVLTADCDCINIGTGNAAELNKSGFITSDETWTADKIYILNGKVVVESGYTLSIEAGTVIKGQDATGTLASALVVARGAKIKAEGTATAPIIFTSINDNIQPGQIVSPNLTKTDNTLWGGLIILGNAPISGGTGDTEELIEGLPPGEGIGEYGGNDPMDDSGILKYISVRHGGISIGADNEINGITFGGVGAGTVVENIEVVANLDDGVEWFGGTVNCKNVVVAFGEDDGLDIDQNYAGTITNAVVITSGETAGDNALEIDGPEGSAIDGLFTIDGCTIIDKDGKADKAADLKSKTQGLLNNVSWQGFGDHVALRHSCEDDCSTGKTDSYSNLIDGVLKIENCEWVGTATLADWVVAYGDKDCPGDEPCNISADMHNAVTDILAGAGNVISTTATKGADLTAFEGWSWVSATGNL